MRFCFTENDQNEPELNIDSTKEINVEFFEEIENPEADLASSMDVDQTTVKYNKLNYRERSKCRAQKFHKNESRFTPRANLSSGERHSRRKSRIKNLTSRSQSSSNFRSDRSASRARERTKSAIRALIESHRFGKEEATEIINSSHLGGERRSC